MITEPIDPRQAYFDKYKEPTHHIAALLSANIITLDIRPRLLYPLANAGIKTVADLLRLYRSGLSTIRNIGVSVVAEIEQILSRTDLINLDLKQKAKRIGVILRTGPD